MHSRTFDALSSQPPDPVVGRAELLASAREHLSRGGSLLLTGPAGIGKSTVLRALVDTPSGDGTTVLRCSPTASEAHLPFLSLIDLLGEVAGEVAGRLPASQRVALESALMGRQGSVEQRDGLALRLAVLSVLRALAGRAPVLLVADDLQWMDPPSAELLAFVARRVAGLPVRMVAALRTDPETSGSESAAGRHLPVLPPPALVLPVPPLSYPHLSELLAGRKDHELPFPVLRDVHRTSGGNPLFALELARALAERRTPLRPGDPLPVPTTLRPLVLDRLRALSPGARRTLLVASAGARPTLALLRAAGRAQAAAEVAEATALGVLEREPRPDGAVRFVHPLVSAVLYAETPPRERRLVHSALAAASTDVIERARHLALATPGEDEHVAATLAQAAAVARDRGAPAEAARLGVLAAERTPARSAALIAGRRLDAAEDALTAGETELARGTAEEVLAGVARPADRVRAWIVVIDSAGQAMAEVEDVFPRALADAGDDPLLLAPLHYQLAWRAMLVAGSLPDTRREAARAASLAEAVGDRRTELMALALQAQAESLMGYAEAEQTLARALAEPQDPRVACDHNGPGYIRFRSLLMSDRLDDARAAIGALVRVAGQRGAVESQILFLRGLAETELRSGRCAAALERVYEALRLVEDVGIGKGPVLQLASLAEAAGGSPQRALSLAREAVHSAEDDGDLLHLARNLSALGHARLVGGDAQGAVVALRRVREMEEGQGVTDPARGRWQGDLAEALAGVGEFDEAHEVVDRTRRAAVRLQRGSVLAVLDRAGALVAAARGELDAAAAGLRTAGRRLGELGYRLEEGRAELELGRVEVRRGDVAAARTALDAAARIFRRSRALPWLDIASAELSALEPPLSAPSRPAQAAAPQGWDVLAGMERRVAGLVLEGATNREIAAQLFISVKTVEATLTRVYRKLGVRSRVDLVRLAGRRTD